LKPRPSSIRIFLAEGSPTGLRFVEKSNWIGRGVVFPRSGYVEAKSRKELGKSGVYVVSARGWTATLPRRISGRRGSSSPPKTTT
jgi:hypothetical protein